MFSVMRCAGTCFMPVVRWMGNMPQLAACPLLCCFSSGSLLGHPAQAAALGSNLEHVAAVYVIAVVRHVMWYEIEVYS